MSNDLENMKNKKLLELILDLMDLPVSAELTVIGHNSNLVDLAIIEGDYRTKIQVDRNKMLRDPIYLIARVRQLLINLAVLKGVIYTDE